MPPKKQAPSAKKQFGEGPSAKDRGKKCQPGSSRLPRQRRTLSSGERWSLLQDFNPNDLEWMLNNESLRVRDFLDAKLGTYPVITSDDEVDIGPYIADSSSLRVCTGCGTQDTKDEMVKCRECHLWYHYSHFHIKGRSDPRRRFWKCLSCRKEYPDGPTPETATEAELEEDDRFEDLESEDLD